MLALFVSLGLTLSLPAFANDRIVVTATRSETSDNELPFSSGAVSGETWEQSGQRPENALAGIPGLSFTVGGGPGQPRFLLLRGAKAEHTLVLVDGVVVNDPLSPSRSFDFGQIPLSEIERVEVIKGPQSVLYGSDAIGGVVQIFTKRGRAARAKVEGGSYHSLSARASALGFHAGWESSQGFSAADERDGNEEQDGYHRWNLGGAQDFALSERALTKLGAEYSEGTTDTDRNGGRAGDSRNTFARDRLFLLRDETTFLLPHELEWTLAGSLSSRDREDNTNGSDFYKSDLWKLHSLWRRSFGAHALTAGLEYGQETGRSSQITGRRRFRAGAAHLQDHWRGERWHATLGARLDRHSEHRGAQTYRAGAGYWLVPEQLRLKGSLGTGFKSPSLYQTYSIYGSAALQPERSLGGDLRLELSGDDWGAELTGFLNRFRDQIDFDATTNRYFNQSRAESYGAEASLERRFGLFELRNAFTYLRALDLNTRRPLLRRPRYADTLQFGFRKGDFVGFHLRLRYVGRREDLHPSLFTRQTLPAFSTLGADFFHYVGHGLRFVARGENLLNRHYQELSGYGVPGISGYAGIEADL